MIPLRLTAGGGYYNNIISLYSPLLYRPPTSPLEFMHLILGKSRRPGAVQGSAQDARERNIYNPKPSSPTSPLSRVYLKCHAVSRKKPNKRWIVGRVVSRCTVAANKLYVYILRQRWWRKKSFAERVIIPVFYSKAVTAPLPALNNILMRISYRVIVLIFCNQYNVGANRSQPV